MSGVVPLDGGPARVPRTETTPKPGVRMKAEERAEAAAREAEAVHEHLRTLADAPRFEVSDDGVRVEGRRVDVAPDLVRKLRRGVMPIDARLDLHGKSAVEARDALRSVLARCTGARGERCVLVIHGKGEHAPGGIGVLRGEISAWLAQGRASEHVAAFATATSDDGGRRCALRAFAAMTRTDRQVDESARAFGGVPSSRPSTLKLSHDGQKEAREAHDGMVRHVASAARSPHVSPYARGAFFTLAIGLTLSLVINVAALAIPIAIITFFSRQLLAGPVARASSSRAHGAAGRAGCLTPVDGGWLYPRPILLDRHRDDHDGRVDAPQLSFVPRADGFVGEGVLPVASA